MRLHFLSYPLSERTPTWLDNPPVAISSYTRIADGDVANQSIVTTLNHNGTHVDAPYHFNDHGKRLSDFAADEWLFERPVLVDVPKQDDELITADDLEAAGAAGRDADLLLVRTGFGDVRSDRERYGQSSPGFSESAADFLLGEERLRGVGMDFPSATAPKHLAEGIAFHRRLLSMPGGRALVIVEDLRLPADLRGLEQVLVAPLILDELDGAPATVIAWANSVSGD